MQSAFVYAKPKILLWLNYKCTNNSLDLRVKSEKKADFAVQNRDYHQLLELIELNRA
jgi:hypothetical protein